MGRNALYVLVRAIKTLIETSTSLNGTQPTSWLMKGWIDCETEGRREGDLS